jgi:hypothetical protein
VLDFKKGFDDSNRIRENNIERLETYMDLINEIENYEPTTSKHN